MKTVLELVGEALKEQGFDGLFSNELGCACERGDLAPCGEIQANCTAGHKHTITLEDVRSGRFDHLDDPPTEDDAGVFWVIIPALSNPVSGQP